MAKIDMKQLEDARGIYNYYGYRNFYEETSDSYNLFVIETYKASIYPAHFHSSCELYYVHSGEMEVTVNNEKKILNAGDLLFINSLEIHSFNVKEIAFVTVLQFGEHYLSDFRELYDNAILPNFLQDIGKNAPVTALMGELGALDADSLNELDKKAYINRILSALIKAYGVNHIKKEDIRLLEIIKYIYQHYAEYDLGLKRLAQEFNYSEVSISRFFSKYIGTNIRQYINSVRMTNVERMLEDKRYADMTITQIASLCGFDSMTTFYRCKRKFDNRE